MITKSGKVKAVLNGKQRLFVFNNNVFIRYCDEHGDGTIASYSKNLKKNPIKFYRDLFHLALTEGGEEMTLEEVGRGEWEAQDLQKVLACMNESMSWGSSEDGEPDTDKKK